MPQSIPGCQRLIRPQVVGRVLLRPLRRIVAAAQVELQRPLVEYCCPAQLEALAVACLYSRESRGDETVVAPAQKGGCQV